MMKLLSLAVVALASVATAKDVSVELYYESLCPGCQQVIEESVGELVDTDCFKAVDWTFVPYGNAQQTKHDDKTVTQCQHGELECHRNKEELCVLKYLTSQQISETEIAKVIMCMEKHTEEHEAPVKTCLKKEYPSLVRSIQTCSRSSEGDKLVDAAAKKTNAVPNREYVPWIMINGQHGSEGSDLKQQLCKASDNKNACCKKGVWEKVKERSAWLWGYFTPPSSLTESFQSCPVDQADVANEQ